MAIVLEQGEPLKPLRPSITISPVQVLGAVRNRMEAEKYRFQYAEGEDQILDGLVKATTVARDGAKLIADTDNALHADKTLTPAALRLARRQQAKKRGDVMEAQLNNVIDRAETAIAATRQRINAPEKPKLLPDLTYAEEIRRSFKRMSEKEREKEIGTALAELDFTVIGALLHGAPFLSGLSKARLELLRSEYQRQFHYDDLMKLKRQEAALELTRRAAVALGNLVLDASGGKEVDAEAAALAKRIELMEAKL